MTAAILAFPTRPATAAPRRSQGIAPILKLPTSLMVHPAMQRRAAAAYQEHQPVQPPAGLVLGQLVRMRNAVSAVTAAGAPLPTIDTFDDRMTATWQGFDSKLRLEITERSYKLIHLDVDGNEHLQQRGLGAPNQMKLAATVRAYYSQQPTD